MIVLLTDKVEAGFSVESFEQYAEAILKDHYPHLDTKTRLNLVFTDDNEVQSLNKQYRQKDATTDVLSFSYLDGGDNDGDSEDGQVIADIIISIPVAQKQADEFGHSLKQECEILFVHGVLHALGFDHMVDKDLEAMKTEEIRYLGEKAGLIHRSGQ